MAWRSRSVFGLLKMYNKPSISYFNNNRLTGISTQIFINNNNNCYQQARFNSSVKLTAFNDVIVNSNVLDSIAPLAAVFGDSAFGDSKPVLGAQDLLCQMHDLAGLNWMGTIVLTTIGLRLVIGFPVAVLQKRSYARLENLEPEVRNLIKDIAMETSIATKIYNWDERTARITATRALKKHRKILIQDNNCHPMRPMALAFLLQVPPWVIFTMALRNLSFMTPTAIDPDILAEQQYRFVQIFIENTSWIDSLITPDPYVFPLVFIATGLLNIQLSSFKKITSPLSRFQIAAPWIARTFIVGVGLWSTTFPAVMSLYWAVSGLCALFVNIFLKFNVTRRLFRIPLTPTSLSLAPNFRALFRFPRFTRSIPGPTV